MFGNINDQIAKIFDTRFQKLGPTPESSMWFSKKRQFARFEIIFKHIMKNSAGDSISISDIGCGYGAFLDFLSTKNINTSLQYYGYDISCEVIKFCRQKFRGKGTFYKSNLPKNDTDYIIMSGTFNFFPNRSFYAWEQYFQNSLKDLWPRANCALIFNLQTSNQKKITSNGIVYASSKEIEKFCTLNFGKTKARRSLAIPKDVTFIVTK